MGSLALLDPGMAVPPAWGSGTDEVVFNPAVLEDGEGWIAAYRVIGAEGRRRIALCRLDRSFRPFSGSSLAWSDLVQFGNTRLSPRARTWFADPRLYRWNNRIFVHWNSGWHEPHNHQFLQEIDPRTLQPIGEPEELTIAGGGRQPLEKNWMFFGADGDKLIYSPQPLRILAVDHRRRHAAGHDELARQAWRPGFTAHGGLRGGCPPVQVEGDWFAICHSVDGEEGAFRYRPWILRFADAPGYPIVGYPRRPLPLPNPFGAARRRPKLNPAVGEVVYPCGAAFRAGVWTVSYGINDEYAAFCQLMHAEIEECLQATP